MRASTASGLGAELLDARLGAASEADILKLLLACLFWTVAGTLLRSWGRVPGTETVWRVGRRVQDLARSALGAPRNPIKEPPEETPPPIDDPDPDSEDDSTPLPRPPAPMPPVTPVP
jgi:hypothetical protein